MTREKRRGGHLAVCGVMTGVTCVLGRLSIPVGAVPVRFANLAIYLSLYLLGWRRGTASCLAYLLLGLAGLPVFSAFGNGASRLLGPTGGYLLGYLPMAVLGGLAVERAGSRWLQGLGLAAGTAALYVLGTAWFCVQSGSGLLPALWACVLPFLPFDLAKIAAAVAVGPGLRRGLERAGLGK